MPVNILTASPASAQATDMPKIEQTLRPQDVLDVIFTSAPVARMPIAYSPVTRSA